MAYYAEHVEDARGDLVDVHYFCSRLCLEEWGAPNEGMLPTLPETDYDLHCENCKTRMTHGLTDSECETSSDDKHGLIVDRLGCPDITWHGIKAFD